MVKHVTSAELEELITSSATPVICDFWASWCGPCRMLGPVFEEVSNKYDGKAVFVKVNVDEEEEAAIKYGISSIPNVLVFKGGKKVDGSLGYVPAPVLAGVIDRNI